MIEDEEILRDEFQELWLSKLTNKQKKERILRAFVVIRNASKKQIKFLEKYEKSKNKKEIGFMYYQNTLTSIWDSVDYAINLGKGKYGRFAFYPARTVLENGFRLEHFLNQTNNEQNRIAVTEFLRVIKRSYEHEKIKNRDTKEMEDHYDYFASIIQGSPKIEDFKDNNSDPFPPVWELVKKTKMEGGIDWYHQYRSLCEVTHGKLFHTIMASFDDLSEYVWSVMYLQFMVIQVLKMTDLYIYGKVTEEVVEVIKEAEKIIKKSI